MKLRSTTHVRPFHPSRIQAARRREDRALARAVGRLTPAEAHEWAAILSRYDADETREVRRIVEPRIFEAFGDRPGSIARGLR